MRSRQNQTQQKIQWVNAYSYRTEQLIEWCNDNPQQRLKLFSDSTQDARKEGRSKTQLSTTRKDVIAKLAEYIFKDDPHVGAEAFRSKKSTYVAATGLKTKYTGHLRSLGQTGAGLDIKELESMQYKSILDKIQTEFPWFADLHGWWRTNPAYNTMYSTAHPAQDFAAEAAVMFGLQPGMSMEDLDTDNVELGSPDAMITEVDQENSDVFPAAMANSQASTYDLDLNLSSLFDFNAFDFNTQSNSESFCIDPAAAAATSMFVSESTSAFDFSSVAVGATATPSSLLAGAAGTPLVPSGTPITSTPTPAPTVPSTTTRGQRHQPEPHIIDLSYDAPPPLLEPDRASYLTIWKLIASSLLA
ncbi:hypothetical protein JVU11DRAFT_6852 [Chiua virens]|nr:hypothetical protein JVU11DRAFT_6852 [Chiua virens]